ncbi:glycine zipper domain-containing protein, partial [Escherichia sp. TWPC-MK]
MRQSARLYRDLSSKKRAHQYPYTGEREAGKSAIGAGLGSLVGAGIGALSSSKKDRGKGALIGAAAGAALGGGVGYYMDVQEAKLRDKMRGTGVSVTHAAAQSCACCCANQRAFTAIFLR